VLGIPPSRSRWERPRIWCRLLRQTLRLRPDLIHFHDPELLALAPLLRLGLGRRVRIIYDVHEYFVDSIAHKVWIPPRLRNPVAWLAGTLERILGRSVDGLIFVVKGQLPLYAKWRAPHVIIHNYPKMSAFADPLPVSNLPADRFRLIYIGALYARRGIMPMLQALSQIVPQAPETLLILGGVFESEDFRRQVESYITEHDLAEHIMFLGWVDPATLKDYLASADVAWLPGLPVKQYQQQAISTKLLECMLMGLPIVGSDVVYHHPFVDEAQCGYLVAPDDPDAHAQAILQLYHHADERQAMGDRGQQLIREKYTWESQATILTEFYEQLQGTQSL